MRRGPVLLLALAACGSGKSSPPPPTQPTVQVATADQTVLGTQVLVNVAVEGCPTITTLALSDHGHTLSSVSDASASTQFTLTEQDLQPVYATDGIAAALDLVANVTCSDGQTATSEGDGVLFMPADVLYPGTFMGTSFSLEPDASGLVQCVSGAVTRLDTSANVLATTGIAGLPYACTDQGSLVRGEAGELYWIEPGTTFSRLNQSLQVLQTYAYAANAIYLPPGGLNFAVATGTVGQGVDMFWVDRNNPTSFNTFELNATIDGTPALGQEGLVVPVENQDLTSNVITLGIEVWSLSTGMVTSTNGMVSLAQLSGSMFGTTVAPLITLSPDGSLAYFVGNGTTGVSMVYACSIDLPCTSPPSGGLVFQQPLTGGPYTAAVPTPTSLLAVGPSAAQFLDLQSGAPVGSPIAPTGGLVLLDVVPGPGQSTYLLSGDSSGNVLEIIILDQPAHEAARYTVPTAGFGFDVDSSLRAYLLQGTLASLLLPSDYASAR